MKLSNQEIYDIATLGNKVSFDDIYIPAKVNFFIQKNLKNLTAAAKEIEDSRLEIAKHYGIVNEETEGLYSIPPENQEQAIKELQELFSIEQELDIRTFSIEDLADIQFTTAQMQLLMIMIED